MSDPEKRADTYQCAVCGGVFRKGWSDAEAAAELGKTFPGVDPAECLLVCDDCCRGILSESA